MLEIKKQKLNSTGLTIDAFWSDCNWGGPDGSINIIFYMDYGIFHSSSNDILCWMRHMKLKYDQSLSLKKPIYIHESIFQQFNDGYKYGLYFKHINGKDK
jgi:hypothetical protein